jgi:hypothetical protein
MVKGDLPVGLHIGDPPLKTEPGQMGAAPRAISADTIKTKPLLRPSTEAGRSHGRRAIPPPALPR